MSKVGTKNSSESLVLDALKNSRWQYRTAIGIAKETHVPVKVVEKTLLSSPDKVRVSLIRRRDGEKLFASKQKVSGFQDAWTAVRALSKAKF